jgi:hypothetical protein
MQITRISMKTGVKRGFISRRGRAFSLQPRAVMDYPEPEPEREPEREPDEDDYKGISDYAEDVEQEIMKKYYYLDPAVIHYHRSLFESLFHTTIESMTAEELKSLAEGHRLQITLKDNEVYLLIHEEQPAEYADELWNSMADLFNDWGAAQRLREIIPTLLADPQVFQLQKEPLEIALKVQHIPIGADGNASGKADSASSNKDILF